MGNVVVIYHGNCQDGFGAAWVAHQVFGARDCDFVAGVYQDPPPDVAGKYVIMVDFSYKRPVLLEMLRACSAMLIIDHHKTAAAEIEGLAEDTQPEPALHGKLQVIFDLERSGAGLAWDYWYPDEPRPRLIDHIEDRDLWRFKLPKTREIAAALFSHPYDFELWDWLMLPEALPRLEIEGAAIERKHHQDIANLLPVVQRKMTIGGVVMPVASLPITLTSDAGHKMAAESGVGMAACYWDTPDGRVFSLRSLDDGPDVSEIAKKYGGGGHAKAAGFRMPIGWEGDGT